MKRITSSRTFMIRLPLARLRRVNIITMRRILSSTVFPLVPAPPGPGMKTMRIGGPRTFLVRYRRARLSRMSISKMSLSKT
jgi:hypothetical protein